MMDRMLHEERVLVHDGKMQHMQRALLQKLLVGDNIKYDIGTFCSDKGFLLNSLTSTGLTVLRSTFSEVC